MRQLAKILFTKEDLAKADAFATSGAGLRIRGTRSNVRMGKLGEIAFAKFLFEHGKALWTINNQYLTMDDVYELPRLDLQTSDSSTVDVKTAKRSNMLVPGDSQKKITTLVSKFQEMRHTAQSEVSLVSEGFEDLLTLLLVVIKKNLIRLFL